jgi:hypothetical protein
LFLCPYQYELKNTNNFSKYIVLSAQLTGYPQVIPIKFGIRRYFPVFKIPWLGSHHQLIKPLLTWISSFKELKTPDRIKNTLMACHLKSKRSTNEQPGEKRMKPRQDILLRIAILIVAEKPCDLLFLQGRITKYTSLDPPEVFLRGVDSYAYSGEGKD